MITRSKLIICAAFLAGTIAGANASEKDVEDTTRQIDSQPGEVVSSQEIMDPDELLAQRVKNGDIHAMYELAIQLLKDNPSNEQIELAVGSLLTAANSGHIESRALLGLMALKSDIKSVPKGTASDWVAQAAAEGVVEAMVFEASRLLSLKSKQSDIDKAIFYLDFASKKGDAEAQAMLGDVYYEGRLTKEDRAKAAGLYGSCIVDQGCERELRLGIIYREGTAIPRNLPVSFALISKALIRGDLNAHKELATAFLYGLGTGKNERSAFHHAQQAALTGDPVSETLLCMMLAEGRGVKKSASLAKEWCEKGASKGNPHAIAILNSLDAEKNPTVGSLLK